MNGESPSATNQSAASSSSTTGATGRKSSRSLISLSRACMSGSIGDARIDRAPSARGPNSMRPWNQPMTLSAASSSAVSCGDVVEPAIGQLRPAQERLDLVVAITRAEVGVVHVYRRSSAPRSLGIDPERRAERRAGVAGRRLHPDALERPAVADPRVHHAVQRDAAGHAEVALAGGLCSQRASSSTVSSSTTCRERAIS